MMMQPPPKPKLARPFLRWVLLCLLSAAAGTVMEAQQPTNWARKPRQSDGIQYVTIGGDNSNDGLSWGTSKASLAGAKAALPNGGVIHMGAGTFSESTGVTFTKPVKLVCAPGYQTVIHYTGTTGAAVTLAWGSQHPGAGIYGCAFTGPGSATNTVAIQISTSKQMVAGAVIENPLIGVFKDTSRGFGTGILMPKDSAEVQNVSIVNPTIQYVGTGVVIFGELESIRGGSISGDITSIKVQTVIGEVAVTGTSMDSDTGVYVSNSGVFTCDGCHFETNFIPLAPGGFVQNNHSTTLIGGVMMDDLKRETVSAFVTNGANSMLHVYGTVAWSAGQIVSDLVTPPPIGSMDGVIAFENFMGDTKTPQYAGGPGSGRVFVMASHTTGMSYGPYTFYNGTLKFGGYNGTFNMATLDAHALNGSYTYTFPNSDGQLALLGANGISAGVIRLSNGTGSHIFRTAYSSAPVCVATDTTSSSPVKIASNKASIKIVGVGADAVSWLCSPAAN